MDCWVFRVTPERVSRTELSSPSLPLTWPGVPGLLWGSSSVRASSQSPRGLLLSLSPPPTPAEQSVFVRHGPGALEGSASQPRRERSWPWSEPATGRCTDHSFGIQPCGLSKSLPFSLFVCRWGVTLPVSQPRGDSEPKRPAERLLPTSGSVQASRGRFGSLGTVPLPRGVACIWWTEATGTARIFYNMQDSPPQQGNICPKTSIVSTLGAFTLIH